MLVSWSVPRRGVLVELLHVALQPQSEPLEVARRHEANFPMGPWYGPLPSLRGSELWATIWEVVQSGPAMGL